MSAERLSFQAEVGKLLNIVANSLYSEREIFLRELVSNASDACDRLRYLALTEPALTGDDPGFHISITPDKKAKTLTIADNGIGMNREDLVENLGTIARSGTAAFLERLTGDAKKDVALIGQFGVGFYSSFMVADKVEVLTRRAGEEKAWLWTSDGQGEYAIEPAEKAHRGTIITLHLKKDAVEFLEPSRLTGIIKTYSDHIQVPIRLLEPGAKDGEAVNQASALWTRAKSEITGDQYKEFYHHVAHAFDEPALTLHWRAEGVIEYTALLFVPGQRPFDLFHPERKNRVKLYVKRVFITDGCEELLPPYLRFLRGIVDSEDLPLNVSREMLQNNPVVAKIRQGLTKRITGDLARQQSKHPEDYRKIWESFGAVIKEGIYSEQGESRDALLGLMLARSTESDGWTTLKDYVGRMKEGQEAIYYITGESLEAIKDSPYLEGFRAKGVEVLLFADPIDDFWIPSVQVFDGKPLKSVTRGGADLSKIKAAAAEEKEEAKKETPPEGEVSALIASLKLALGETVKDVRTTERLTDSPVCLVADENDMDIHLERMLRAHGQLGHGAPRILEINPGHALIAGLARTVKSGKAGTVIEDAARLLLDQARIVEGEPLPDPKAFARRLSAVMERAYGG